MESELRLWLVRHGESTWNAVGRMQGWGDPPLTPLGEEQARQVAQRLATVPLDAVYTSPLQRAHQTAQTIAARHLLTPQLEARLREHGVGEATGMVWSREEAIRRWPHLEALAAEGAPLRVHIPGAEQLAPFTTRVTAAFAAIRARHPHGDVAVVCHGGVLRVYLGSLQGLPPGNSGLRFENASLSLVVFTAEREPEVRFVNEGPSF